MKGFTKDVKSALGDLGTSGGKTFSGGFLDIIKGSAIGTALGNLASSAIGEVMSGISVGIGRLDTIQNFPTVMEALGYTAEDAASSISHIMEHLDGLPTATQDMVALTQSIADSTGDLDLATAAALGFNDMMLANGASTAEIATAQGVLNRVLGKGSATAAQWLSLQSVMPAQLSAVAQAMLGTGASSEDLHSALEDGTVSWNDFLQAIADLDKNGYINEAGQQIASFEEQARANSHGIGTAIDNIQNRIGAGWAKIFETIGREDIAAAIDRFSYGLRDTMYGAAEAIGWFIEQLGETSIMESFATIFSKMGEGMAQAGSEIADMVATAVPPLLDFIDGALQWIIDNGPFVESAVAGITAMLTSFFLMQGYLKAQAAFTALKTAATAMFAAFGPIPLIIAAVGALVAGLVWFFTETETGKEIVKKAIDAIKKVWEDLKKTLSTLWKGLQLAGKQVWDGLCKTIGSLVKSLSSTLKSTWTAIKATLTTTWNAIKTTATTVWNALKAAVTNATTALKMAVVSAWTALKTSVTNAVNAVKAGVTSAWNGVKTTTTNTWNAIKNAVSTAINGAKSVVDTVSNAIKSALATVWAWMMNNATTNWNAIKNAVSTAINAAKSVVATVSGAIQSVMSSAWNAAKSTAMTVWNGIQSAISGPINTAKSLVSGAVDTIKGIMGFGGVLGTVQSVWNGIKSALTDPISAAKDTIKGIVDTICGFFNVSISFPHIPLPHFGISPAGWVIGDLLKGIIPSLSISWYAKGGVFSQPAIVGVGERGTEAVLPLNAKTYGAIARGIEANMGGAGVTITGNTFIVRDEYDIDLIAERLARKMRREGRSLA